MNTQQQVQNALGAAWGEIKFLTDLLVSTEFPAHPVVRAKRNGSSVEPQDETGVWQSIVEKLVDRIAAVVGARQVQGFVRILGQEYCRCNVPVEGDSSVQPPMADLVEPTHIAIPILASKQWVGYIDVRKPQCDEFTTEDKRVIKAAAALMGLAVDRTMLRYLEGRFADSLVEDCQLQSMLHHVWTLTENRPFGLPQTLDSVIRMVKNGVLCEAATIAIWDDEDQKVHELTEAANPVVLSQLQGIVEQEREQALANGSVWARVCTPASPFSDNEDASGVRHRSMGPVIMVPLRRLAPHRGLLALARDTSGSEFNTDEKQALCIVSGLLNGLN